MGTRDEMMMDTASRLLPMFALSFGMAMVATRPDWTDPNRLHV